MAAGVHAGAAPVHFERPVLRLLLATVAGAQLAWALAALRRPSPAVWARGLVLHAAVVFAWLVSRTSGLPLGPHAGMPEPVGVLDALATGAEVVLALACARLLQLTPRLARL